LTARPIHVRYVRSGGLAGLRLVADVDTADLATSDPGSAARIEMLAAHVSSEPPAGRLASPPPDGYQHDLTISREGQAVQLRAWDGTMSESLKELVELIGARAVLSP
jgi:hypothetical protein